MQKIESFSDASYHLAQIKIARILAPIDDVIMAEFVAQLPPINALSECSVHEFSRIYAKDVKHSWVFVKISGLQLDFETCSGFQSAP